MLQYINQRRGQSTLEYAVLVVVIIGALIAINFYLKRGIQGRLKSSADDIGDQFSPDNTNAITLTNRISNTQEITSNTGVFTNMLAPEQTNTISNSVILNTGV